MWKVNSSYATVENINGQVYDTDGRFELLPIEVNGKILSLTSTIDEIDVADNEILMFEVKLQHEKGARCPWTMMPMVENSSSMKK